MIRQHTPSFRFQAHLAFPQGLPSIQKCKKSLQARPTLTHGQKDIAAKIKDRLTKENNDQLITKCICHKGFSGYSSVVARSNFHVRGQKTVIKYINSHILNR